MGTEDISPGSLGWLGDGNQSKQNSTEGEATDKDPFDERRGRPDRRRTRNHVLELRARRQGISLDRRQPARSSMQRLREMRTTILQWWNGGGRAGLKK